MKAMPYVPFHMIAGDPLVARFWGGTVSGRIVTVKQVDGSQNTVALSSGFDPVAPNESQGYNTQVATRFVGMAELPSDLHGQVPGLNSKTSPSRRVSPASKRNRVESWRYLTDYCN